MKDVSISLVRAVKESTCHFRRHGFNLRVRKSPWRRLNGNPSQYPCLGNPMAREAWWATVHGVTRVGHDLAPTTKHLKKIQKTKTCWAIQAENSSKEKRKRKRQEIRKWENRLEQRKQHRGNDQREDVEKSPDVKQLSWKFRIKEREELFLEASRKQIKELQWSMSMYGKTATIL